MEKHVADMMNKYSERMSNILYSNTSLKGFIFCLFYCIIIYIFCTCQLLMHIIMLKQKGSIIPLVLFLTISIYKKK